MTVQMTMEEYKELEDGAIRFRAIKEAVRQFNQAENINPQEKYDFLLSLGFDARTANKIMKY